MGYHSDPNQIGSDAWRARQDRQPAPVPMTVTSARSQLNQPTPQPAAPQVPAFESEAHAELVKIAHRFNEHLDETDRNAIDPLTGQIELTPALKKAHANFDAKGIDTIVSRVDENVAEKKQKREQIRKSLVREGDTASEIRASRRWEADRSLLDSQNGSLNVGRQLLEAADDAELSVLVEQLPACYAARGIDATRVIDETVARKCPQLAEADREARRAEQNAMVIRAGAQRLRAGITSGTKVRAEALVDPSKCAHNQ